MAILKPGREERLIGAWNTDPSTATDARSRAAARTLAREALAAQAVAEFLDGDPRVRFIWYPGLASHPQHDRAVKYMNGGFSGMIAFDINGDEKVHQKFLDSLRLITHAVSLGDIESLIVYYDKNSDKLPHYPPIYREGFFRFSIGLEDPADLIADLSAALDASGAPKK